MKLIKNTNYEVQLIWIRTEGRPIKRLPKWQLSGLAAAAVVDDDDDDDDDDIGRNVWNWWSGWDDGV